MMCGRFALASPKPNIEKFFNIEIPFEVPLRYNIAPTQDSLVLCGQEKIPQMMHWGFLPFWSKDNMKEQINAKSETIHEKPMFRNAFKEHRCIVVASGFFEWQKREEQGKIQKTPFYITPKEESFIAIAGIWDRFEKDNQTQVGFTILTTQANALVAKYHNRMPVILNKAEIEVWLNHQNKLSDVEKLFNVMPAKYLKANEVSRRVNSPKNDDPECIS